MSYIHNVMEQVVAFDSKPEFPPARMIVNLVNHYAYPDINEAREDGCKNPIVYRVRVIIEYEQVKS